MPNSIDDKDPNNSGEQTDGPVLVPITIQLSNTGTITAFTTITADISMPLQDATGPISIGYYEDNNPPRPVNQLPTVPIPGKQMPTAAWNTGGTGDATSSFQININQTLVNALVSPQSTELVVNVTSGDGEGLVRIPIAFP